jgi:hypothetical protein
MLSRRYLFLHPILFAAFPVLSLYSRFGANIDLPVTAVPLSLVLTFTLLLWATLWLLIRQAERVSLLTSGVLLVTFTYGHAYHAIAGLVPPGSRTIPSIVMLCVYAGVLGALAFAVSRVRQNLPNVTRTMVLFGLLLLLYPTAHLAKWYLFSPIEITPPHLETAAGRGVARKPNVYYVILDGFARADILQQDYGSNDQWFVDSLAHMGFQVGARAKTNYGQTMMSLASSLNVSYIDDLISERHRAVQDRRPLRQLLLRSAVLRFFSDSGYRIVSFSSGYTGTELKHTGLYLAPFPSLNEFDQFLLQTTPVSSLLDLFNSDWQYDLHRERVLYAFEALPKVPADAEPFFAFVHIVSPHPPFVFGSGGEKIIDRALLAFDDGSKYTNVVSREEYIVHYRNQIEFIEHKTIDALREILANAKEPPIIIIQSDHGPGSHLNWEKPEDTDYTERLAILNALYLPGENAPQVPSNATPVNTFRIILNGYFGTTLPLLEDRSYFSTWLSPYVYVAEKTNPHATSLSLRADMGVSEVGGALASGPGSRTSHLHR